MQSDTTFLDGLTGEDRDSAVAVQHARHIWGLATTQMPANASDRYQLLRETDNSKQLYRVTPGDDPWFGRISRDDHVFGDGFARLAKAGDDIGVDVIYGDDLTLVGDQLTLRLKPSFDRILLTVRDYIGNAALIRASALKDFDRALLTRGGSITDVLRHNIRLSVAHLPYPVMLTKPADRTIADHPDPALPKISIIIPTRDSPDLIQTAVRGVLDNTSYPDFKIIIVDNGSKDPRTLALYETWSDDPRVQIIMQAEPFNFARMVNRGAAAARGDALLLLNNDIEVQKDDWLRRMAHALYLPDVGIVGAKLLFPDGTIQHAGVTIGHGGVAGHAFKGAQADSDDGFGRLTSRHRREAVTAAAMLIRREVWDDIGGFDEKAFPVAFNDVDFCLRAGASGWQVVVEPAAVLTHHEGQSRRGFSITKFLRHQRERKMLRLRHRTVGRVDRFDSPWHDPNSLIPQFRMLNRLPKARF